REFRADEHRILCLCNGLRCRRCGRLKMHRPTSSYYNERDGRLWHIPWFYAPTLCGDCDPLDRVNARAWAIAVSAEPGVRPDETYHASEASFGPKVKSRCTLVGRYGGVFSEPLDALLQFQGASGASTARTFAATFSEDDDRDAYVLFVAISREPPSCARLANSSISCPPCSRTSSGQRFSREASSSRSRARRPDGRYCWRTPSGRSE